MMKTIWTNVSLTEAEETWLRQQVEPYELIRDLSAVNNLTEGKGDPAAQEAEILFGQPAVIDILHSNKTNWIHLTSAGYTRYDTKEVKAHLKQNQISFTNSSSVYDLPCAEHALSLIFTHNRLLLESDRAQTWTYDDQRPRMRVLKDQNVLIVGYGAIGRKLTELLKPFGCHIKGIKRTVTGNEEVECDQIGNLDSHLGWADHVVNILPLNTTTNQLFGPDQFAKMKIETAFYNIGRGDTVNQTALLEAIESNQIRCAYLDVVSPEPLPDDHPFWSNKRILITPHVAGGLQSESQTLLAHFVNNFRRFVSNEPLNDQR